MYRIELRKHKTDDASPPDAWVGTRLEDTGEEYHCVVGAKGNALDFRYSGDAKACLRRLPDALFGTYYASIVEVLP